MAAKKKTSSTNGMTADTYSRKAAAKSSQLRATKKRYNRLEAALIDAGVPMSRAEQEAQLIMEKAMKYGPGRNTKGRG